MPNKVRELLPQIDSPKTNLESTLANLVCPKCKQALKTSSTEVRCDPCQLIFSCGLDFNALFDEPDKAVALAYLNLYKSAARWRNRSNKLSKALKTSDRKKVLLPLLKAQIDNRAIFERWAKRLEQTVKPAELLEQSSHAGLNSYGYNFSYLTRDWTAQTTSRFEVKHVLNGLKRCLRLSKIRGKACILGMGTGRFGLELTDYFTDIWGIDASFGQVMQYHELLQNELDFWQINSKNQVHHQGMAKKMTASIPLRLKERTAMVKYIWADALNSPFTKHYFDWVFSIYFSDVKPLPDILKEVKRILRPGGLFLHFGPLEYHFKDIRHHYSYDEFKTFFIDNGFEIIHESTSTPPPAPKQQTSLLCNRQYIDKVLLLRLNGHTMGNKNQPKKQVHWDNNASAQ